MSRKGFTLVEILIVVILLGVIAAIVLPKFSNASETARQNMLAENLRIMRTQMIVFQGQHGGVAPGYPGCDTNAAPTEAALVEHLTKASTPAGDIAEPGTGGYPYGPYLREIPTNPLNNKASFLVLADDAELPGEGTDEHGWVFHPASMTLLADSPGTDDDGKNFIDY